MGLRKGYPSPFLGRDYERSHTTKRNVYNPERQSLTGGITSYQPSLLLGPLQRDRLHRQRNQTSNTIHRHLRADIMTGEESQETFPMPTFASFTKTWHNKPYSFISPNRAELSAAGKNVMITGGGTGIGKAIAIAFAQAGAASVSIQGRRIDRLETAAKEIRAAGPQTQVLYQSADMAQVPSVEAAMKSIADQVGKIDIFVHSAGISPAILPLQGYDEKEFRRGFEMIVMGAYNAIQAVLPLAAPDAKFFNISSGIAHMKPIPGLFNYAATKLAVVKLFDYVAVENPGLHVINIQPGVIKTEMNEDMGVEGQDERTLMSPIPDDSYCLASMFTDL